MAISDAVVGNLTTLYLSVIVAMKAYGLVSGRSFGGAFVLIISTAVVGVILIASLTWDVSRKATYALARDHHHLHHNHGRRLHHHHHGGFGGDHEMCRGGICWHGVAVKSPAAQVRFRLPNQNNNL